MTGAQKSHAGKPRYDLIPAGPLKTLAMLMGAGAVKRGPDGENDWRKGPLYSKYYRAMIGHANDWWSGEDHDSEDGQHHLDSVIACAMILRAYTLEGRTGLDDRFRLEDLADVDPSPPDTSEEWVTGQRFRVKRPLVLSSAAELRDRGKSDRGSEVGQ